MSFLEKEVSDLTYLTNQIAVHAAQFSVSDQTVSHESGVFIGIGTEDELKTPLLGTRESNTYDYPGSPMDKISDFDPQTGLGLKNRMSTGAIGKNSQSLGSPNSVLSLQKQISTPVKYYENPVPPKSTIFELDLAIIYSSPVVEIIETKHDICEALLRTDDYPFGEDVQDWFRVISREKKALNMVIECASLDQFIRILKKQPRVMHIVAHCDWDHKTKEFCLLFENNKMELLRLSTSTLSKMVDSSLSNISLLILSSPYAYVENT